MNESNALGVASHYQWITFDANAVATCLKPVTSVEPPIGYGSLRRKTMLSLHFQTHPRLLPHLLFHLLDHLRSLNYPL